MGNRDKHRNTFYRADVVTAGGPILSPDEPDVMRSSVFSPRGESNHTAKDNNDNKDTNPQVVLLSAQK